jgi:hypothetical protein
MILLKSTLAGIAALLMASLATYGIAVGAPRVLQLTLGRDGFTGAFFYPVWQLLLVAFLIFALGFFWGFRRASRHRGNVS